MAFFTIAFFWLFGLFCVWFAIFVLSLYLIYCFTGGKLSFLSWFKAMNW